jgi:hypothetical protein
MKQPEKLTRMRYCAQLVLATIRIAEESGISDSEYFSAQNAIDAIFILWNNENQVFSDEMRQEVHLKLERVFKKKPKRKDVFNYHKVEKLFDLILKETESPRKHRGLVFYTSLLFLVIQEFS